MIPSLITRSYEPGPPILGYAAWYDASDPSKIVQAAGLVSQWNDKSANAGNVAQATNKPLTGGFIGDLNAINFDGVNDILAGARPMTAQPFSIFVALINYFGTATAAVAVGAYNGGAGNSATGYKPAGAGDPIAAYGGTSLSSSIAWRIAKPHVVSSVINGASSAVSVDGRPATTGNAGTTAPGTPNWGIGGQPNGAGQDFWKGYIGEVVVYTSALSVGNRLAVEQYLIQKWLY